MLNGQAYLDDCLLQLQKLKTKADQAIAQVKDNHFFATLDPESNSIALIMKHLSGNMRSRWTDFLTTDGEKPNRNRDNEFEQSKEDTRESILASWEDGWGRAFSAISALEPEDLDRTIKIQGEPHTGLQAINRQLTHYAAHVGQIILLAKHYASASWQTLSIPRGKSKEYDVSKGGQRFKP
jgi:hypothetical protein